MTVPVSDPPAASDPDDDIDGRIVRTELGIACATFVTASMLTTVALPPTGWWPVPPVALGWGLLTAASDRSRAGLYLLYGAGVLAMAGVVWAVVTTESFVGAVPLVLYGLGVGSAANRLLFGVVRPVPTARRKRERS
ncbi:hypothetical protein [Haloplanus natans]|uniref:hypothetical protein n=1 Tax=Haloplanus natans TaxID=376171 RepID=UPI0006780BD2|nr:hypothetical protein [Haloplanus natans]